MELACLGFWEEERKLRDWKMGKEREIGEGSDGDLWGKGKVLNNIKIMRKERNEGEVGEEKRINIVGKLHVREKV
jgi:hypothetical protein